MGILTQEQSDGGHPGGANDTTIQVCRVWGEPPPHDFPGETEFVEEFGFVFGHPAGQNLGFPNGSRGFITL